MMSDHQNILSQLPYDAPFRFVDQIDELDEEHIVGGYRFRDDEYFYQGHFRNNPVTPGVILVECMAQIGLVCLGIHLRDSSEDATQPKVAFTAANVDFLLPVLPGEEVRVKAVKQYWRLGKLKVLAEMFNSAGNTVCKGEISGMIR